MVAPEAQRGFTQNTEGEHVELTVIVDKDARNRKATEVNDLVVGEKPRSIEGAQEASTMDPSSSLVKTHDGVFANMSAKPQVMVLPLEDTPPAYEANPPSGNILEQESAGDINAASSGTSELMIEGLEVGTYPVFILFMMGNSSAEIFSLIYFAVSVFFGWFGFIITYIVAQSHAAKYGSLVGLGATMVLQSPLSSEPSESIDFFKKNPEAAQFFGFLLAFGGYVVILTGFYAYRAKREAARDRIASRFF